MKSKNAIVSTESTKPRKLVKEDWGYSLWEDLGAKGFAQIGAASGGMFTWINLSSDQKKKLEETGECVV